jgi:protein-tyrosine phosphatase
MASDIYWIESTQPRLAIMARPRAGDWLEDEIANWHNAGIATVVSLLERHEIDDLDLGNEAALCATAGIRFLSFPIADRGLPNDSGPFEAFIEEIANDNAPIAIHCRAGIGRSAIVAAALLVRRGIAPALAIEHIAHARGTRVPDTEAQRDWILRLSTG